MASVGEAGPGGRWRPLAGSGALELRTWPWPGLKRSRPMRASIRRPQPLPLS